MDDVKVAHAAQDLVPAPTVRALLFDWDGTLFDNHEFNFLALQAALARFGVPITAEWFHENSGFSAKAIVELALEASGRTGSVSVDEVLGARDEFADAHVEDVATVPDVHALLEEPGDRRLGVVTGSNRSNIEALLQHHGLAERFDVIVTRDELKHGKPDPEGYLLAMARLGVDPAETLVYEDSDQGIAAALASGAAVVDVRALIAPELTEER